MQVSRIGNAWRIEAIRVAKDAAALGSSPSHGVPADLLIEDHFTLTRVEHGRIWIEGLLDGREVGPIAVPEEISRRCQVGWTISSVVGRLGRRWRLVEVWNVLQAVRVRPAAPNRWQASAPQVVAA